MDRVAFVRANWSPRFPLHSSASKPCSTVLFHLASTKACCVPASIRRVTDQLSDSSRIKWYRVHKKESGTRFVTYKNRLHTEERNSLRTGRRRMNKTPRKTLHLSLSLHLSPSLGAITKFPRASRGGKVTLALYASIKIFSWSRSSLELGNYVEFFWKKCTLQSSFFFLNEALSLNRFPNSP